ncbi:UDP-N-acetylmuramoyl-L-alanyl-D-glutamate--2,6-diaminopimelate ligase [Bacillaceae bacterium S4-13-58]
MLLTSVVKGLSYKILQGDVEREVSSIAYDSRESKQNSMFVAISGFTVDGHSFIQKAIENGATTIVVEKEVSTKRDVTILQVDNTREALALLSANFYDYPTGELNLIGVTGTNGKTSTTYFIKSIFEQAKRSIGLIGTIGTVIGDKVKKNNNTTPESLNLQETFQEMVHRDIKDCIMEVSSHALSLKRVAQSAFNTGIFTNLTPDHLELHHNMDEYFEAKAELFQLTSDFNIINADDPYGKKLIKRAKTYTPKVVTYGIKDEADIYPSDIQYYPDHTLYKVHTPEGTIDIQVNLPGDIYVYNSLAAIACAYCNGISLKHIQEGIRAVEHIRGRLEVVYQERDYRIVIDFAHTEDSLEKVLSTLRPSTKGRIILVFGVYAAPGELGSDKRKAMGRVAAEYADFSVITSDNPKEQDPQFIVEDVAKAVKEADGAFRVVVDREEAIRYAIQVSEKDDTILIAGKGHETSQIIGKEEIPFNESEIVYDALKKINGTAKVKLS